MSIFSDVGSFLSRNKKSILWGIAISLSAGALASVIMTFAAPVALSVFLGYFALTSGVMLAKSAAAAGIFSAMTAIVLSTLRSIYSIFNNKNSDKLSSSKINNDDLIGELTEVLEDRNLRRTQINAVEPTPIPHTSVSTEATVVSSSNSVTVPQTTATTPVLENNVRNENAAKTAANGAGEKPKKFKKKASSSLHEANSGNSRSKVSKPKKSKNNSNVIMMTQLTPGIDSAPFELSVFDVPSNHESIISPVRSPADGLGPVEEDESVVALSNSEITERDTTQAILNAYSGS